MPNWCSNHVKLRHSDPSMLVRAQEGFREGKLLSTFHPCPQEVAETESAYYPSGSPEETALRLREEDNLKKYGARNWYDWQVANWGTKWDVGGENCSDDLEDGELTLGFDSAWGPPIEAYVKMTELGFEIVAYYYEPGMGFCGSWVNGADVCINIPVTSAEAEKVIPEDIDDMFDIVNSMAMWEEEEAGYEDS